MRKLLFLCFLLSGAYAGAVGDVVNNPASLEKGLYFGKRGGFFPPVLVYVIVGETTVVEVYQRMKGEVFEITKEVLQPTGKDEGPLFAGEGTAIIRRRSSWYLTQIGKIPYWPEGSLKDVRLKHDPAKAGELDEYRNRAYLFSDFDNSATAMTEQIKAKGTRAYESERVLWGEVHAEFMNAMGKTNARELARKLPHHEFLSEYEKIRRGIIEQIVNK